MPAALRYETEINLSARYPKPTPITVSDHVATATIGIAIPSYHAAGTLEETLRSCVTQTFKDWIAFVTVDGEDATLETKIVQGVNDPRIFLECNETRLGQMANFNRAVLRCYAAGVKWIKTLSADDLLYPDALQRMVELGNVDTNCGLVFGYFDLIDGTDAVLAKYDLESLESRIVPSREFTRRIIPFGNPTGGPSSVMFRSRAIEQSGLFDGSLNYTGDREYWFRLASKYNVGILGKRAVLAYRHHANSVSGREHATAARFQRTDGCSPLDRLALPALQLYVVLVAYADRACSSFQPRHRRRLYPPWKTRRCDYGARYYVSTIIVNIFSHCFVAV